MFVDTNGFRCYYIPVRFRTGGVAMPLDELATERRIAGRNGVLRGLKADYIEKVFLSREADKFLLDEIIRLADQKKVSVEWADTSVQLGRACAVDRKTAVAAILKK